MHRSSSARPGHEGFAGKVAGASLLASAALGASLLTAGSAAAARAEVHRPATSAAVEVPFLGATTTRSFAATTSSLKTAVSSAGMMVLGQLNQAGALSVTGLHLKGAETFFVGNPTTGKKLFAMDPAVGIEIPLGMYLWVDHAGRTEIGYFHPAQVLTAVSVKFKAFSAMFDSIAERVAHSAS